MLGIYTKFIPATNTKGARIKASVYGSDNKIRSATIPYPHEYGTTIKAHYEAVKALIEKYKVNWPIQNMRYGSSHDGKGFFFCFAESTID
jgi:hypothetical protein